MNLQSHWARQLRDALVDLGVAQAEARRLASESELEAAGTGSSARDLYGPAHPYARELVDALKTEPPALASHGEGAVLLDVRDVTKSDRRRRILDPVSFTVRAGEVVAIVGANGAGKSTLLHICAGMVRPSSGEVYRSGPVGYVPQDGGLIGKLTAAEHFDLLGAGVGHARGRARSAGELLASRLSWRPGPDPVEHLSGGTRQKLNVILGELGSADLLLLDEPYQGFDQASYVDLWRQVFRWRDAGRGVVLVTHLLQELDAVDRVVELSAAEARTG